LLTPAWPVRLPFIGIGPQITTAEAFSIYVVKPDMAPLGQPLGGTYMGNAYSEDLQELASKLREQSELSKRAATYAAIAAILQAVLIFIP
jgi:hypothetical protein